MDIRRLNDTLKVAGAAIGAIATFGPVFAKTYTSLTEFLLALSPALVSATTIFLSGLGTRAIGTEYQDVADAKAIAKASLIPPPLMIMNTSVTPPKPGAPTEAPR